eukprot:5520125-Alexandrium_andersonii.AAC.1
MRSAPRRSKLCGAPSGNRTENPCHRNPPAPEKGVATATAGRFEGLWISSPKLCPGTLWPLVLGCALPCTSAT